MAPPPHPSLVAKEGRDLNKRFWKFVILLMDRVSAEVMSSETEKMVAEAKELSGLAQEYYYKNSMELMRVLRAWVN